MAHDVFISYASQDGPTARQIAEHLQSRRIRCWIDKQNLRFAGKYDRDIEKAIRGSRVVLWLASARSIESNYVQFEIATAFNCNRPIGPLYLEPLDPARLPAPFNLKLANVQGIKWFEGTSEANLEKLAAELQALIRRSRRRQAASIGGVLAAAVAVVATIAGGILMRSKDAGPAEQRPPPIAVPSSRQEIPPAMPLPARLERLAAADVLKVAYGEAPPTTETALAGRLAIQMAILARPAGESDFAVLKDGDSLASEKDDYFLAFRPASRGFLYVFQVDSAGNKTWLFPKNTTSQYSSGANPVEPQEVLQVPPSDANRVLFLDRNLGVEHVYTVFSMVRWPALETALGRPSEPTAAPASGRPDASLPALAVQSPNGLQLRGVGGSRLKAGTTPVSFTVDRAQGSHQWSVPVSGQPLEAAGSFLVIERWFNHIASP